MTVEQGKALKSRIHTGGIYSGRYPTLQTKTLNHPATASLTPGNPKSPPSRDRRALLRLAAHWHPGALLQAAPGGAAQWGGRRGEQVLPSCLCGLHRPCLFFLFLFFTGLTDSCAGQTAVLRLTVCPTPRLQLSAGRSLSSSALISVPILPYIPFPPPPPLEYVHLDVQGYLQVAND